MNNFVDWATAPVRNRPGVILPYRPSFVPLLIALSGFIIAVFGSIKFGSNATGKSIFITIGVMIAMFGMYLFFRTNQQNLALNKLHTKIV